jgi:hypothetical protein
MEMQKSLESRHQETAILTKGVENVCRKLVRFLIGRISLVKLQEIVKFTYIEEIESLLRRENPTKNVPLTQFALLSGLDTRTLTKVRNSKTYRQPLHQEVIFLEEITPGASILDTWCSKPPYVNEKTGEPLLLDTSGSTLSFEALFNESTKSRGVTYKSLLKRLIASNAVSVDPKTKKLQLEKNSYLPANSNDYLGAIEMGFSALGNMTDTVTNNILSLESGKERLYQRGAWTYRLNPENREILKQELRELLASTDSKARAVISKHEDKFPSSAQITAGVSLFYFEESEEP